jgi:hypothetical protein
MGSLSFFGWQGNLRPLLTRDPAAYATRQNLTLCQMAQRQTQPPFQRQLHGLPLQFDVFAPARLCVLVQPLWLGM